jgi:hypothetical protein
MIFAYCRIDDISWGTKGLVTDVENSKKQEKIKEGWATVKYLFICKFIIWNVISAIILEFLINYSSTKSLVIFVF